MKTTKAALRIVLALGVVSIGTYLLPAKGLAQLVNISTRGVVGTADNVMIAGFIIGGTSPVEVLIRGRGPSLSGAPFFVPATLANPFLQIFSGQSVIAQNDNWQDEQRAEILATGLDPCEPNPGQKTSPPGCNQESAILVTLPPEAYTAIMSGVGGATGVGLFDATISGVNGATGVGLIEVFELTGGIAPPSILGTFTGSLTITQTNCQNAANNVTAGSFSTLTITGQSGSLFSGTVSFSTGFDTVTLNVLGTVVGGGALEGSFNSVAVPSGFQSSGMVTGSVVGRTITINLSGRSTVGDICTVNGTFVGSRP